jgi:hypothetical protein
MPDDIEFKYESRTLTADQILAAFEGTEVQPTVTQLAIGRAIRKLRQIAPNCAVLTPEIDGDRS